MYQVFTQVIPRRILWIATCALLILCSACGNPSVNNPTATRTATSSPPGTTTLPTSTAGMPTPPPVTAADWMMYHRDPARTGYVADAPDPRHLTQAWKTLLDHSVYGDPLVVNGH